MSDADLIHALKVAFMDVNEYDFPGRVDKTLADIECVREALLARGIDPDEVAGEFDLGAPESSL